jgi:hypothetical protein
VVVQAAWHSLTTRARHAAKAFVTPHCCCDRVVQVGKLQAPPSGAGVLRFTTGSGRRTRLLRAGLRWRLFRGSARATRRLTAGRGTRRFAVFFAPETTKKKDKKPTQPTFRTRDTAVSTTRLRRRHTQKKAHKKEQNSLHLSCKGTSAQRSPHQTSVSSRQRPSCPRRSGALARLAWGRFSLALFFFLPPSPAMPLPTPCSQTQRLVPSKLGNHPSFL